jgi:beta-xylosidase
MAHEGQTMIEAVMFWNEPNNKSHWAFEIDPEWRMFADMIKLASHAVAAENRGMLRVLGGISPIDPGFIAHMKAQRVLENLDAVAVHGFPLDWNHWNISEWPDRIAAIEAVTNLPVWVSEAGASSFGAQEVQAFGLRRTAELLCGRVERIHWYSLYDLPRAWPATTRHREEEGSSYYRHFYMGLLLEDGTPKLALEQFADYTPDLGICQWFHFDDHRLDEAVQWLHRLGVKYLRTGLSWADSFRPHALDWFDRQMQALEAFDLTLTFCFTPESRGIMPHHTSPPQCIEEFAEFCVQMVRRYGQQCSTPSPASELEVSPVNLGRQRAAIPAGSPSLTLTGQSDRSGDNGGRRIRP